MTWLDLRNASGKILERLRIHVQKGKTVPIQCVVHGLVEDPRPFLVLNSASSRAKTEAEKSWLWG